MPTTGSCLCGAATFTIDHAPKHMGACHCGQCRKWSGGVLMSVEVPADAMRISGDTIRTYTSSEWGERAFCSTCGSSLYFRMTAPGPMHGIYFISAGTLDQTEGMTLNEELFIDEKPAGYALKGDHKTITGAEFFAMIEAEMKPQG